MAVRSAAPGIDAAVRSAANAASAIAAIISFCVNAAVEPPELHVAFNSTAGLARREFIEAFLPDQGGPPGFGGWIDTDSLFAVKGHQELPGDGHEICPLVATRSARWRPPDGLRGQVLRGITPFPARAWDRRMLSPAVWQMCA